MWGHIWWAHMFHTSTIHQSLNTHPATITSVIGRTDVVIVSSKLNHVHLCVLSWCVASMSTLRMELLQGELLGLALAAQLVEAAYLHYMAGPASKEDQKGILDHQGVTEDTRSKANRQTPMYVSDMYYNKTVNNELSKIWIFVVMILVGLSIVAGSAYGAYSYGHLLIPYARRLLTN